MPELTEADIEDARHEWALALNKLHDAVRSGSSIACVYAANKARIMQNRVWRIEDTVAGR